MVRAVLLMVAGVTVVGCGPALVKASNFTPATVDLPMMARKRPLPIAIVITPQSVPNSIEAKDEGGGTRAIVSELRPWLFGQLKDVFGQIHDQVTVVESETQLPHQRHVQVHVMLKRISFNNAYGGFGNVLASQALVTWSIGLRMSDQPEYFHSSVATIGGDLTDVKKALNTAFVVAIQHLAADYVTAGEPDAAGAPAQPAPQGTAL